jgi:hypothetical protein
VVLVAKRVGDGTKLEGQLKHGWFYPKWKPFLISTCFSRLFMNIVFAGGRGRERGLRGNKGSSSTADIYNNITLTN